MLTNFVSNFFAEGKRIFAEDVIGMVPDLVGYSALFAGGLMIVSPLIGRSVTQAFGVFVFAALLGVTVMGAF